MSAWVIESPDQVAARRQVLRQLVHPGPEGVVGAVVGALGRGEPALVDAVVDVVEDPLPDLLDRLRVGPQVRCAVAVELPPLGGQVPLQQRVLVGDDLARGDLHHRGDGDALGVAGDGLLVGLAQVLDPEHRVDVPRVEVEAPAALVVQRARDAQRYRVLQPEQPPGDDHPVRPRAGARTDEAVAARLHRPRRRPVGRDPLGHPERLPHELTAVLVGPHARQR